MAGDGDGGGRLSLTEGVVLIGVGVLGVIFAFWVLSALAGLLWGVIKLAVVGVLVVGVLWLLFRRKAA